MARAARAVIVGLLAFAVFAGCKKKSAGGPPPNFPAQVVLAEAKRQPIAETLALVGSLAANEIVEIKSETDGTIAEIPFHEGQEVKKGDLLIRLDESKLAASLAEAEANLKLNETTFERNKQLFQEKLISQQEYDQSAASFQAQEATVALRRRQLQDTRIFAPFSGVVGARSLSPGQVITKNTTLTWLVDASVIKAEFHVPERFIGELKSGQHLELLVASFPNEKFRGEVYFIAPNVDEQMRTVLVKARIANEKHLLKPGMFANLDLTLRVRDAAVVIPETAVMLSGQGASVWIQGDDGAAELRPVQLGIRLPGEVEVVQGLAGGEKVVAEGIQKVAPGRKLIPAASKGDHATNASPMVKHSGL
jgi:membrane fusion protein (multidrug efflux system)